MAARLLAADAALAAAAALCILLALRRLRAVHQARSAAAERGASPPLRPTLPLTYVISLARRPAKRNAVLKRVAEAGLERVSCIDAVDGREVRAKHICRLPYDWDDVCASIATAH